jgi:hypothetical protein
MKKILKPQTVRQQLVEHLTPLLPKAWKIVPFSRSMDALSQPVVMVHMSRIEKHPAAPLSKHLTTFTVSVFDPQLDDERAQGALDDEVNDLIFAIDQLPPFVNWSSAEPSQLGQNGPLGWDITLELITTKES